MKLIKKISLIIFGIFITLIISEIVLRFYTPEILNSKINDDNNKFFKWAYLDIHTPYFKIDGNTFYIQRKDICIPERDDTGKYEYNKKSKRIFILGESTAKYYPKESLEQTLHNYFDCEVINCGMGSYDSYRIEKVSKEISSLNPDWVICFIGNNDEVIEEQNFPGKHIPFNPIDINYIPYKYPFIRKIFTLNLLSNIFNGEIKYTTQNKLEKFFRDNIIKTIKNLKNCKIIFIGLPNNTNFYTCFNINDIIQKDNKGFVLWKDTNHYKVRLERARFIEKLQETYNNVFCINLTDILLNYCNNDLGYNIFDDNCYWTKATYELLSEIISQIIMEQDFNKNIEIKISKENFNKKLLTDDWRLFNYGIIDYFIKNRFNYAYEDYITKKEIFKNELSNERLYNNICLYAYCLYENNYKTLSLNILNELISLQPNYIEAYLTLGYIQYKENNIKKAEEYFNIATKLEPNNKINVEYLKHLKEEKNENKNSNN